MAARQSTSWAAEPEWRKQMDCRSRICRERPKTTEQPPEQDKGLHRPPTKNRTERTSCFLAQDPSLLGQTDCCPELSPVQQPCSPLDQPRDSQARAADSPAAARSQYTWAAWDRR